MNIKNKNIYILGARDKQKKRVGEQTPVLDELTYSYLLISDFTKMP